MKFKNLFAKLIIFSVLILISFTTTSANITHVGYISGIGAPNYLGGAAGLCVEGEYAYVGCTDEDAISIFDISDPSNPVHVGVITGAGPPNYISPAYHLLKDGDYLYVSSYVEDALVIIDVSDPTNPTFNGQINGTGAPNYLNGINDIFKSGDYVYVSSGSDNCITIIDVSDPSNPTFKGYLPQAAPDYSLNAPQCLYKKDNFLIVTSHYGISSIDVTDPTNPVLLDYIRASPLGIPRGLSILGNYAYTANQDHSAINVVDISNPNSLSIFSVLQDTDDLFNKKNLVISDNTIFVVGNDCLTTVDISTPSALSVIDSIAGEGAPNYLDGAWEVAVSDDYIYVTSYNDHALTIFNVPVPTPVPTVTPVTAPPPIVPIVPTPEPTPEPTIEETELTIIEETIEKINEEANNIFILLSSFILKGAPFFILILGSYAGASIASIYFDKMSNVVDVLLYGSIGWIFVLIINLANIINVVDMNIVISFSIFTIIGTISYTLSVLLKEEKNK